MLQTELVLALRRQATSGAVSGRRLAQAAPAERATLGGPVAGLAIQLQAAAAE